MLLIAPIPFATVLAKDVPRERFAVGSDRVIPPAFRGKWAADKEGCDYIAGYTEISDDYILGGEQGGEVISVAPTEKARSIAVRVRYQLSQSQWRDDRQLWTLNKSGNRLTIMSRGKDKASLTWRRCD